MKESVTVATVPPGLKVGELVKFPSGAIYQKRADGALRRIDKPAGTKKERRRRRAALAAMSALPIDDVQAKVSSLEEV